MSDVLSALIASIYAAAMALNGSVAGPAEAEVKAGKAGVPEQKVEARNDFKRAENKANADYKAAIADCRKKPPAEKYACLEDAMAINDQEIMDAKASFDKTVAEARATEALAGIETGTGNGMPATLNVRFLPDSVAAPVVRAVTQ